MKKIIILVLAIGVAFSGVSYVRAEEAVQANTSFEALLQLVADLQKQILALQTQVVNLQTSSNEVREELQEVKKELRLSRTLRRGMSGEDVRDLQEFLSDFEDVYPEGLITGFFGELTERAIRKFQQKNGIVSSGDAESTGFGQLGPKTRDKLHRLAEDGVGKFGKAPFGIAKKFNPEEGDDEEDDRKEDRIKICHIPSGNVVARHIETISLSAIGAHLAHGDTKGNCVFEEEPDESEENDGANDSDKIAPQIFDLRIVSIKENSAVALWQTSEVAKGLLVYGELGNLKNEVLSDWATVHEVHFDGLIAGTAYEYYIVSWDEAGNETVSVHYDFVTLGGESEDGEESSSEDFNADKMPPEIFDIAAVNVKENSAVVIWQTDESAWGTLVYGEPGNLENEISGDFTINQEVHLTGLAMGTDYAYYIVAWDEALNETVSAHYDFVTLGDELVEEGSDVPGDSTLPPSAPPSPQDPATVSAPKLTLLPYVQTLAVGNQFSVDVLVDTDFTDIVSVAAHITFDDSLLSVTSIDTSQSAFPIIANSAVNGNTITIDAGAVTPGVNTQSGLVATINFQAIASGFAAVDFQILASGPEPSQIILDDGLGTDVLAGAGGALYTIQ